MFQSQKAAAGIYLVLLMSTTCTQSAQQIFYKTFDVLDLGRDFGDVRYDPMRNIYPVIHLPETCPFSPIESCDDRKTYWEMFEQRCNLGTYCPNGTHAQCVENKEYLWKHVLLLCAPFGNCDRDARNVAFFDKNQPNVYLLGKKKCEDGRYHPNNKICFGDCTLDNKIRIAHRRTEMTPASAFCNYQLDYCNATMPTIFQLPAGPDACYSAHDNKYSQCPHGTERMPDCSCADLCKDGYIRDPTNNFTCQKSSQLLVSTHAELFRMNVYIEPHAERLRLSWTFSFENGICVSNIKVKYRKVRGKREHSLEDIVLDNRKSKYTDIEQLFPGQTYEFKIQIIYEHDGNLRNITLQRTGTVRPNPVKNLTISFVGENLELRWETPKRSRQDHYRLEYRMVRRNRKSSWSHNTTRECKYTLHHPFPGEEFEIRVYSISNSTSSTSSRDSAVSRVIPPLSPERLYVSFPSHSSTDVTVSWFINGTRSHVEKWSVVYNSSNGDSSHMDEHLPDTGKRVQASFSNLKNGQTYRLFVYSIVGNVRSAKPVYTDIEIPEKENEGHYHFMWIIIFGTSILVVILVVVVLLVVLFPRKKDKVIQNIRNIRNNINIDQLSANVDNSMGDLNIPIGNTLCAAFDNNGAADVKVNLLESEDS